MLLGCQETQNSLVELLWDLVWGHVVNIGDQPQLPVLNPFRDVDRMLGCRMFIEFALYDKCWAGDLWQTLAHVQLLWISFPPMADPRIDKMPRPVPMFSL